MEKLPKIMEIEIGDMKLLLFEPQVGNMISINDYSDAHFHANFEVHYGKSGCYTLKTEKKNYSIQAGDCVIVPPNTFHRNDNNQEDFSRYVYSFCVSPGNRTVAGYSEYNYYSRIFHALSDVVVLRDAEISRCFDRIEAFVQKEEPERRYGLEIYFTVLIYQLTQALQSVSGSASETAYPVQEVRHDAQMEKMQFMIEQCIHQTYTGDDSIEKIAELLHMSKRNAARIVYKLFGKNISEIIKKYRLEHARVLIQNTDMKLIDVADTVGYGTYVAFFTAFKKYYGQSPEQYRLGEEKILIDQK